MLKKTYKYRLYPTEKQATALQRSLDACRWVYNKTLELRKNAYQERQESLSLYDTSFSLITWKTELPTLANAYSQSLQNAQVRVDLAFKAFFRRVKAKENPGYPRFRGFDRYDSFTFPQSGFKLIDDKLKLSKIGFVKIRKHRQIDGVIKTLTIRRINDKWYACFSCDFVKPEPLPKSNKVVGIDVGLESFATFSTGEKISNPRFFRTDEVKLAKAQRRLSKQDKGTAKRKQTKKIVSRIHEKIANKRNDFAHKLSRTLINKYQTIAFEKLNIKQMQENGFKGIRKSIGDVAWNQFIQFTTYKAAEAGRTVVCVNPRNTSKMCSRCGQLTEKKLSDRVHSCSCGCVLDRDHNAALNILRAGMRSLASA
jgi:putative transposase